MGSSGSVHHRLLAIPTLLSLLHPGPGEEILDLGCGPGVLAPSITHSGARYTGVDKSPRLLAFARRHHGTAGRFLLGDATALACIESLTPGSFDAVTLLLSIQDIDPLDAVLESVGWALRDGGRVVVLMTHPCFRVPRQSGWGWDAGRRLQFRRVDRYLTPLDVPMKPYGERPGATRSYHRPLGAYVNGLARRGMLVDRLHEVPVGDALDGANVPRASRLALREIPLFLGLRAVKR